MRALSNIAAIVQKEWRHYFGSPIAWVALFVWTLTFGVFFYPYFDWFARTSASGRGGGMSLGDLIRDVLRNVSVITLFAVPMLTMRLFSEEKRQGTMELLSTSPITEWQIVLGKFAAALGLFSIMLLCGVLDFGLLWLYAEPAPDWRPLLTGLLALFLWGSAAIALGLFLSSLTKNQIVAGILTFSLLLAVWILPSVFDDPTAGPVSQVFAYLGVTKHLDDLFKGVIDLKDVVFFLSFAFFALFLSRQSLESQRWRA